MLGRAPQGLQAPVKVDHCFKILVATELSHHHVVHIHICPTYTAL